MSYQNKNTNFLYFLKGLAWGIVFGVVLGCIGIIVKKYNNVSEEREYTKALIDQTMSDGIPFHFNTKELLEVEIVICFMKKLPEKDIFTIKCAFRNVGCNTKYFDIFERDSDISSNKFVFFINNVVKEAKFLGLNYDFTDYVIDPYKIMKPNFGEK
jgi:hypothetical protein